MTTQPPHQGIARGAPAFRRASVALFLAGFSTFSLLYCVQPLLPVFAEEFNVSPAQSALTMSLATALLAFAILCAAVLSEGFGRRNVMFVSMISAAVMTIAAALAPGWTMLLVLRAVTGFVLGGVPAVAMTWLAEELEPRSAGYAMGLYVGGTAFGGMAGRVGAGILTEFFGWRWALGVFGVTGMLAAIGFVLLLPPSRNFVRRTQFDPVFHLRAWLIHLAAPGLRMAFLIAFTGMGAFITIFNYVGFHLTAPPYRLGQSDMGLLFLVYIFGIASSSVAGPLTDRFGRRLVLPAGLLLMAAGVALTLLAPLAAVIAGIVVLAIGFFFAHSIASATVGIFARQSKGHASSLYLLSYYAGSSLAGWIGGWFYAAGEWPAVAGFTLALLGVALAASLRINALTR
ncbi:MAG: major facilitator superfamily protein [Hyphomicrobiales bacterium]|nr:major facilitator superfamily protein [Hyphomicrobiales bacterium]